VTRLHDLIRGLGILVVVAASISQAAGEDESAQAADDPWAGASGREIMEAVYERHRQYPYVYEEQSMVLIDRDGRRQTRTLRRYSRVSGDGTVRLLLLFDSPKDVMGVALLAERGPDGSVTQSVYLPAFSEEFIGNAGDCRSACGDHFLGSDFSVESLTGEALADYVYVRRADNQLGEARYYVIDVQGQDAGRTLRRHYVSARNLFIERTDYLDELGKVRKRQTHHDLARIHGDMWRANILLMDNVAERHQSIIRIERRVFSSDYVPEQVFTADWLRANHPPVEQDQAQEPPPNESVINDPGGRDI
jgi:hypothetical protein